MCSPGFVTVSQAGHQSGPVAPQCAHAQKTFQSGAPRGPDSGRRVTAAERVPTGRRTSAVCEGVTARPCGGIEQPGDPAENCGSLSRIRKRKTKAFDREGEPRPSARGLTLFWPSCQLIVPLWHALLVLGRTATAYSLSASLNRRGKDSVCSRVCACLCERSTADDARKRAAVAAASVTGSCFTYLAPVRAMRWRTWRARPCCSRAESHCGSAHSPQTTFPLELRSSWSGDNAAPRPRHLRHRDRLRTKILRRWEAGERNRKMGV
ncbi:hypothetical protein MRX96_001351 [Rhipicephalus microplus]